MVAKRITELSGNEEDFNKAKPMYNEVMKENGYDTSTMYKKKHKPEEGTEVARSSGYTPYNKTEKRKIGKIYYSCTINIATIRSSSTTRKF